MKTLGLFSNFMKASSSADRIAIKSIMGRMKKHPPRVPIYTNGIYGFVPKNTLWRPSNPNGTGNESMAAISFLLLYLEVFTESRLVRCNTSLLPQRTVSAALPERPIVSQTRIVSGPLILIEFALAEQQNNDTKRINNIASARFINSKIQFVGWCGLF